MGRLRISHVARIPDQRISTQSYRCINLLTIVAIYSIGDLRVLSPIAEENLPQKMFRFAA